MGWLPREAMWNRMITRICNEVIFSFYPSVQEPGYHVLQQLPERVQHEGNCSGAADLMSKGHEGLHVGLIEGGGVGKSLRGDPESELANLLIADLQHVGVLQNTIAVQQAAWVSTLLSVFQR